MKNIFLLITFLTLNLTFAQKECEYSSNVTDSIGSYKSTKEYLIQERVFGGSQSSIYFSLINSDGLLSLNVQTIQKSKEFIPAKCFDKSSKVYFQLSNGKIVTLLGIENESCGNALNNSGENVRVLGNYFLFMKDSFEELKNSPISLMRIKYAGETVDYIFKSELTSEIDKLTYYPENYFINYLKCIE